MKNFRTSNIDFVAYLRVIGIDFVSTEKSKNNNKTMFSFDYDFDKLIYMQKQFNEDEILISMSKFREARNRILDVVKLYNK